MKNDVELKLCPLCGGEAISLLHTDLMVVTLLLWRLKGGLTIE